MIKTFKYHNSLEIKNKSQNITPIEHIKTITRSRKSKDIVDKVMENWKNWKNWKKANKERYEQMDQQTQIRIQESRVLEQIVTGNIY